MTQEEAYKNDLRKLIKAYNQVKGQLGQNPETYREWHQETKSVEIPGINATDNFRAWLAEQESTLRLFGLKMVSGHQIEEINPTIQIGNDEYFLVIEFAKWGNQTWRVEVWGKVK